MNALDKNVSILEKIKRRYNPENDIAPGVPLVSATDRDLLEIIENLMLEISALQDRITELERVI